MFQSRYTPLKNTEEEIHLNNYQSEDDDSKHLKRAVQKRQRRNLCSVSLGLLSSLALNIYCLYLLGNSDSMSYPLYSHALAVSRYSEVVFSSGFGIQQSPFQGTPSEENNKLWENLYNFGISRITAEEARLMPNKTLPIPGDREGYVVQLSVFHLLHCLNLVRRGLYSEVDMSNVDDSLGIEHLDHCVDQIRQSVMCSVDVTPLTFARQSAEQSPKAVAEVLHSCRDFTEVQRWALERQIPAEIDFDILVTDDPLGWGSYQYSP